jgi:hypothetical protein
MGFWWWGELGMLRFLIVFGVLALVLGPLAVRASNAVELPLNGSFDIVGDFSSSSSVSISFFHGGSVPVADNQLLEIVTNFVPAGGLGVSSMTLQ